MKPLEAKDRIIVALDVSDLTSAFKLVNQLSSHVGFFKVGFEFIYSTMATLLSLSDSDSKDHLYRLRDFMQLLEGKILLDVKLNDIPNTIGKAAKAIARINPAMFTMHASAGSEAIGIAATNKGSSKLFGVTVLTSFAGLQCKAVFGDTITSTIVRFAYMLLNYGADGIICAPKEAPLLRSHLEFKNMIIACPNVRPAWATSTDDQNKDRQMTPGEAVKAGIDMLIIGRPITSPPPEIGTPLDAAKLIAQEIHEALQLKEV
ncbi:MAG: orotidine 5'-phosphate decarboxylase [Candidatus Staskawiczbacteria bacterium RIFCSPLOWO2_01_FULL_38_12b]|uniref:Orotidine 5'-phosphate decarboxylase n=1 Tax=Candidatus Staskawiczbacteria bacterium RIFCSPLOWO2_01_FULL_38_12b TaxID=1802214 RepID=A0A1G2IB13_9BACT|nr:MAG: orotidine 5'-phosphate decarboxylase [Candidatus Staskawiczbacteria bacterium RIFCSPLOWO2_01_FULL_38_12b]